jgi:hypothetical protein
MNRAQRRQLDRDVRRNIDRTERVISLPPLLDEFTVFDVPQRIFDQISNGSVDAVQGVPVFVDNEGVLNEVVPALTGWIFTWQKISDDHNMGLSLTAMDVVCKRLNASTPLTNLIVAQAKVELNACRAAFRTADRKALMATAKTAQIQIMMEPA